MSCIEVMRKLTDYLQGTLDTDEANSVRRHVEHCRRCDLVLHSAYETLRTYFAGSEDSRSAESNAA